jgi:hypothetical protein
MAQLVPSHGPRLSTHATPPWNLSSWGDRLTQDPHVRDGEERKNWSTSLKEEVFSRSSTKITSFCRGALTNANTGDDTPIGIDSGRLHKWEGSPLHHTPVRKDRLALRRGPGSILAQIMLSNLPAPQNLLHYQPVGNKRHTQARTTSGPTFLSPSDRWLIISSLSTGTSRLT